MFTPVTSIVRCLCSVMLTVDWSWRGNVLYFMNVMKQRGDGKKVEREPESLLSATVRNLAVWGE